VRILLVEDDPYQRRVMALLLAGAGHEVVECRDAAEARRAEGYDWALVDRQLPDGDGLDLAVELKGPALLLTGEDLGPDERARLQAARVALLTKPVRPKELEALLAGLARA